MSGDPDEEHTIEEDIRLAVDALDQRDLEHAVHHLGGAIGADPENPELPGLIDRLLLATDDPLALVPLQNGMYYGAMALHAAMLARRGDAIGAAGVLLQAQAAAPEVSFVPWVERWLAPVIGRKKVDPAPLFAGFNACLEDEGLCAALLPTLRRLLAADETEDAFAFLTSRALRQTEQGDEALAVATRAHELRPTYRTSISVALALAATDDVDGAIAAYEEAIVFEPNDVGARLDIGDHELTRGDWDAAIAAYEAALEIEPENRWALPSTTYARARRRGHPEAVRLLRTMAAGGVRRAIDLLGVLEPYVHALRTPPSSLEAFAEGVVASEGERLPVTIAASSLEAPSAVAALADTVRWFGEEPAYTLSFAEIPDPDPREPRLPVEYALSFDEAIASGGEGASAVAAEVAALAGSAYGLEAWASEAYAIGERLGADAVGELLRAMVQPPPCPEGALPWAWRFRVQLAAALILAGVEPGWDGSKRRAALLSLLHGPVDWTTTAGAIALVEIAAREEEPRAEILGLLLDELMVPVSPIRFQCVIEPIPALLLARVPLPDETARTLRDYRDRMEL